MAVSKLTAVLGTCRRKGRWEVSKNTSALVVFGRCHVDYRQANADPELERITVKVFCLFGAVTMIMRPGTDVRPSVVSLLASSRCDVEAGEAEEDFPPVVLEITTLFGRCRVVSSLEEPEVEEEDEETPSRRAADVQNETASESREDIDAAPHVPVAAFTAAPPDAHNPVSLLGATVASLSTTSSALPEDVAQHDFHDPALPTRRSTTRSDSFTERAQEAVAAESDEASVSELAFVDQLESAESAVESDVGEVAPVPPVPPAPPAGDEEESSTLRRIEELDASKAVDLSAGPTIRVAAS